MPALAKTSIVSGVRRGYEFELNRPGNDLEAVTLSDPKPWVCQARCARNSRCRAWSMERGASSRRCILKDGIPAAQALTNTVCGRKGMEFF